MISLLSRLGRAAVPSPPRFMSTMVAAPYLLSPSKLRDAISSGNVSVLDASWFMPNSPRRPLQEFQARRIPGAQFLDLDEVASPHELGLKHMMPSERLFADACGLFSMPSRPYPTLNNSEDRKTWYPSRLSCGSVSSSPATRMTQKETTTTQIRYTRSLLFASCTLHVQGIRPSKVQHP